MAVPPSTPRPRAPFYLPRQARCPQCSWGMEERAAGAGEPPRPPRVPSFGISVQQDDILPGALRLIRELRPHWQPEQVRTKVAVWARGPAGCLGWGRTRGCGGWRLCVSFPLCLGPWPCQRALVHTFSPHPRFLGFAASPPAFPPRPTVYALSAQRRPRSCPKQQKAGTFQDPIPVILYPSDGVRARRPPGRYQGAQMPLARCPHHPKSSSRAGVQGLNCEQS